MMDNTVEIYAFVGVVGSGKSYRLNRMARECQVTGGKVAVIGDFSDGIREATARILNIDSSILRPESEAYRLWKDSEVMAGVTGRDILCNVGEGLKSVLGKDIWAQYTSRKIERDIATWQAWGIRSVRVLFGSVRFNYEARAVFNLAHRMGVSPHFIFCDYPSPSYNDAIQHPSEQFAQGILKMGCRDGQDITKIVKTFCSR